MKVLIVEDDVPSLELMTEALHSLKVDVCPLGDSVEAAALVSRDRFDGIFLDLEMPGLSGLELAQKIRKSSWNQSTPIVLVTGHDQRDTMQQAFANGVMFYLQKPIDRQKLTRLYHSVQGPMLQNRRRCTRVPLQAELTCVVGSKLFRGRTWNISNGGIQVEVDSLSAHDVVRISIKLPKSPVVIDAIGEVVWIKNGRQGIRFTKVDPKNQENIQRFIEQIEPSLK